MISSRARFSLSFSAAPANWRWGSAMDFQNSMIVTFCTLRYFGWSPLILLVDAAAASQPPTEHHRHTRAKAKRHRSRKSLYTCEFCSLGHVNLYIYPINTVPYLSYFFKPWMYKHILPPKQASIFLNWQLYQFIKQQLLLKAKELYHFAIKLRFIIKYRWKRL